MGMMDNLAATTPNGVTDGVTLTMSPNEAHRLYRLVVAQNVSAAFQGGAPVDRDLEGALRFLSTS